MNGCHARRITKLAEVDAENERIEARERDFQHMFYSVSLVAILLFIGWVASEFLTHYRDAKQVSEVLVSCLNGRMVAFDGHALECKLTEMVALK